MQKLSLLAAVTSALSAPSQQVIAGARNAQLMNMGFQIHDTNTRVAVRSKYMPHQGKKEIARRLKQLEREKTKLASKETI